MGGGGGGGGGPNPQSAITAEAGPLSLGPYLPACLLTCFYSYMLFQPRLPFRHTRRICLVSGRWCAYVSASYFDAYRTILMLYRHTPMHDNAVSRRPNTLKNNVYGTRQNTLMLRRCLSIRQRLDEYTSFAGIIEACLLSINMLLCSTALYTFQQAYRHRSIQGYNKRFRWSTRKSKQLSTYVKKYMVDCDGWMGDPSPCARPPPCEREPRQATAGVVWRGGDA